MSDRIRSGPLRLFMCAAGALIACAGGAGAVVIHNEGVNGDLSSNRLAPSPFFLSPGVSSIIATTGSPDLEYVRVNIPAGATLNSIVLASYTGADQLAFIAIQAGTTFTEAPATVNPANLLGWTHFGPAFGHVGTDILDDMGTGPDAIGFTPPLPSGDYTFWIQQLGQPATYQLDLLVVPAPSGALVLGAFAAGGIRRRRA